MARECDRVEKLGELLNLEFDDGRFVPGHRPSTFALIPAAVEGGEASALRHGAHLDGQECIDYARFP